ncbi:MAG: AI-2E family transporter, partial [Candidatus Acetothermia bacterium]
MSNEFLSEFKSLKTFVIVFGSLFVLAMILNIIQPVFQIFLMLFMGILFSVFLSGIGFLIKSKVNVSYRTAVTIAILALLVLSLLGGWFMGRQAIKEFSEMIKKLPKAEQTIQEELNKHEWGKSLLHLSSERDKIFSLRGGMLKNLTGLFSETIGQAVSLAIILITGIYMALNPTLY